MNINLRRLSEYYYNSESSAEVTRKTWLTAAIGFAAILGVVESISPGLSPIEGDISGLLTLSVIVSAGAGFIEKVDSQVRALSDK